MRSWVNANVLRAGRRRFLPLLVALAYIYILSSGLLTEVNAQGAAEFVVVDSLGQDVGPVIGTSSYGGRPRGTQNLAVVALQLTTDDTVFVPVTASRENIGSDVFWFQSTDCTGQAFLPNDPNFSLAGPFVASGVLFGDTVLVEAGLEQAVAAASRLSGGTGQCDPEVRLFDGVPVSPAFDLTVFMPPFSVEKR